MDSIYECAKSFRGLLTTRYLFVVSKRRTAIQFTLDFMETDFYHLAGFQHLDDIAIERDRNRTLDLIDRRVITDGLLAKSRFYRDVPRVEYSDVKRRIEALCRLEQYLDARNYIKVFAVTDARSISLIGAEYVIKSSLRGAPDPVYIFLRRRRESDNYCVASFFPEKNNAYGGEMLHWMLKLKITATEAVELYRHPGYTAKPETSSTPDGTGLI
ncbi:MAG: hypothetical protein IJ646_03995 [Clostridia bacterium]|nr:hypothetical protein [Clostridia bacterium]